MEGGMLRSKSEANIDSEVGPDILEMFTNVRAARQRFQNIELETLERERERPHSHSPNTFAPPRFKKYNTYQSKNSPKAPDTRTGSLPLPKYSGKTKSPKANSVSDGSNSSLQSSSVSESSHVPNDIGESSKRTYDKKVTTASQGPYIMQDQEQQVLKTVTNAFLLRRKLLLKEDEVKRREEEIRGHHSSLYELNKQMETNKQQLEEVKKYRKQAGEGDR